MLLEKYRTQSCEVCVNNRYLHLELSEQFAFANNQIRNKNIEFEDDDPDSYNPHLKKKVQYKSVPGQPPIVKIHPAIHPLDRYNIELKHPINSTTIRTTGKRKNN